MMAMATRKVLPTLLALCTITCAFVLPQRHSRIRPGWYRTTTAAASSSDSTFSSSQEGDLDDDDADDDVVFFEEEDDDDFMEEDNDAVFFEEEESCTELLTPQTTDSTSSMIHMDETSMMNLKPTASRRKLDLMWCMSDSCKDAIREKVVGDDNHMTFDGPATGQVCYVWENNNDKETATQTLLLLVKRDDEDLVRVAAQAVQELIQTDGLEVHIAPDLAAKLKHYYGVDDDKIKLYEPTPISGFGGNHVAMDDKIMGKQQGSLGSGNNITPDLVCTLGGDGLLMHASMLFQESCPPILCVAGGSLGFLTRFSRDEMVEAIRIALGLVKGKDDEIEDEYDPSEIRPSYKQSILNGDNGFQLGVGNRICISMRMRLDVRVINREGVVRARFNVLNEVVIDRGASPYLSSLECFVDDLHLTTVQADGIIFATPTGSTAYSMAAGGSVVHPAVPGILITPICPHVLSFRSMVFPDSVVLRLYVPDDARADASVAFDGRYRRVLHRGDSVQVQMSKHPVPTINRADHSADWLVSLKENFNFNARVRQKPNPPGIDPAS